MKKLIYVVFCVCSLCGNAFGNETNSLRRLRKTGGWIVRPSSGLFVAYNCQNRIDLSSVQNGIKDVSTTLQIKAVVKSHNSRFDFTEANDVMLSDKATACVFVIDDTICPVSLVAPENHWGMVNIAKLAKDNPEPDKLQLRFEKQFARVSYILLGAWSSKMAISVLQPGIGLDGLDKVASTQIGPDTILSVHDYAEKIGFRSEKRVPYRVACKQGWAPPPTNEYQKAVWDEVYSIPTNPIKIKANKSK